MLMCVKWGQMFRKNDFIATVGGSSGVRCLDENDFIATGGESIGVKRLINCFQGCPRWLTKCINFLSGHVRNPGGHVIKNLLM